MAGGEAVGRTTQKQGRYRKITERKWFVWWVCFFTEYFIDTVYTVESFTQVKDKKNAGCN